jgi:hypothetical protein
MPPIPTSYTTLPTQHITLSHHPPSSPTATPVIIVTLNRPHARNAFTIQMMADFELVYPLFDVDERVKCIVLTGNPAGKAFCAGADLDIGFNAASGVDGKEKERVQDSRDTYVGVFSFGGCVALLCLPLQLFSSHPHPTNQDDFLSNFSLTYSLLLPTAAGG